MRRCPPFLFACSVPLLVLVFLVVSAQAGVGTVGIRITASNVDQAGRSADIDIIRYERTNYYSPTSTWPLYGYPDLDYGDGAARTDVVLALASPNGGPGGSSVYRTTSSLSHTWPAYGGYTLRVQDLCTLCGQTHISFFTSASAATPVISTSHDFMPSNVIGNLTGLTHGSISTYITTGVFVRYAFTAYYYVTNTLSLTFDAAPVPALSPWGVVGMGLALLAAGLVLRRRVRRLA